MTKEELKPIDVSKYTVTESGNVIKDNLKQEAKEYADKYGKSNFDIWDTARFAYYQSAEPREKRIAKLEAQIEKMKSDVIKSFGNEYNVLVAKLLKEWEIK